jgi:hypothetical protein
MADPVVGPDWCGADTDGKDGDPLAAWRNLDRP